jgi:hypothetical protein
MGQPLSLEITNVALWLANKSYLSKSGNQFSLEIIAHFQGYCLRCGLLNHCAIQCRIYSKTVVLTLCCKCMAGFHVERQHPKFRGDQNDKQKVQKLEYHAPASITSQGYGHPFYYPFPPPPPIYMVQHKGEKLNPPSKEEEDEDYGESVP